MQNSRDFDRFDMICRLEVGALDDGEAWTERKAVTSPLDLNRRSVQG